MRSRCFGSVVCALLVLLGRSTSAEDVTRATVVVGAQFGPRTSLRVSTSLLQFEVAAPGDTATVAIDFSAGARTTGTADIVLSVEPLHAVEGPGGAADVETHVSVGGEGEGIVLTAPLADAQSTVVGRWQGSGLRQGRLLFTLRAAASGRYSLPVRFVLSTP